MRYFVFGLQNFIPVVTTQWSSIILPVILKENFHIEDEGSIGRLASLFFASFFSGMIIGCVLWPFLSTFVEKRTALLISVIGIGLLNGLSGMRSSITLVILCRFLAGILLNIHTVGKDFLFQFVKPSHRQFVLSIDSAFGLLAHLVSPHLGVLLYDWSDRSFKKSTFMIMILFMIVSLLFILVFFLYDSSLDRGYLEDSETESLLSRSTEELNKGNLFIFALRALRKKELRNGMIVFALATACTNCDLVVSVILLQTKWSDGGYGIEPMMLSNISMISYPFALFILFICPILVRGPRSRGFAISLFLLIFALSVSLTPLWRDVYGESKAIKIVLWTQLIKYITNSHIFSPFMHFTINIQAKKTERTLANSLNFIISTSTTVIMMNTVVPLISMSLHWQTFKKFEPWNRYLCFHMLFFIQMIAIYLNFRTINSSKRVKDRSLVPESSAIMIEAI